MSLEHLVVPESKEMLRKKKRNTSKGHKSQLKELLMTKARTTVAKTNKTVNREETIFPYRGSLIIQPLQKVKLKALPSP